MAEDMRIYDDLKDLVETEIEKIVKKDDLDEKCLDYLDKLVDIAKDVDTIYAMREYGEYPDEGGYSGRMYPHYGMNGNSYQGRDNRGRYMRNSYDNGMSYRNSYRGGGYSREGDTMSRLQSMMDEAQTEREREAIRRAMDSM